MKKHFSLFLLFLLSLCCLGQERKATTPGVTIIHAGHMLDVKTGHTLNNVWVVIEDGKIVRVGAGGGAGREHHRTAERHTAAGAD
jgi:imidazolonepropionase-like amidohydrolase